MQRYSQLADIVKFVRPQSIIEVGTHSGKRADRLCREALKHNSRVHYTGYDLFDLATPQTDAQEANGKGPGSIAEARRRLDRLKQAYPGFTYDLVRGNTRKTLHGTEQGADLVYIDGGHSVETIRGDYEAVKLSRVIVFDDWYEGGIDTSRFGCNAVLEGVPHIVLPRADRGRRITIRLAAIGYDPKWAEALEACRPFHHIKTIALWRHAPVMISDLIACINCWEASLDADAAIEEAKKWANKRIFFVIKEDAVRSIAWWRETLDRHLRVEQWFGERGEVCGTGVPLLTPERIKSYAAMDHDGRLTNIKANIGKFRKRLVLSPNNRTDKPAILVCYGPSLQQTWREIAGEAERTGGTIVSVSGAHDFLLERGIVPHLHVECDPRPHKAKNLNRPHPDVKYHMASCCHPDLMAKLDSYDVTLWHIASGEQSIHQIGELEPDGQLVMGGGNVGLRSISIMYGLGHRRFSIYGMDCSFADDGKVQHAGAHAGSRQEVIDIKTGNRWFKSSAVLMSYVEHFRSTVERCPDAVFELHGEGLLQYHCQMMVEEGTRQRAKEKAA